MAHYTVTITREDSQGQADPRSPQAIVRVRTEGGRTFIQEVIMRASEGSELLPGQELPVDLELLLRAFSHGQHAGETGHHAWAAETQRLERAPAAGEGSHRQACPPATEAAGRPPAAGSLKAAVVASGRPYRRIPDAAALREAYEQAGTITGVAQYFGVPRHTAQGWITRLRRRGVVIGSSLD
jgi:hypothetical protein